MAKMVTFPTASGDGQGMLAVPQAPGPGVLLLPDFRGLAPDTVAAAQRLARAGCPTLAVDFLHRMALRFGDFYEQAPTAGTAPARPTCWTTTGRCSARSRSSGRRTGGPGRPAATPSGRCGAPPSRSCWLPSPCSRADPPTWR